MYETGLSGAKMYQSAQQALKQQQAAKLAESSVPQYGGDCALPADGLASSIQRVGQAAANVKEIAEQLGYFFAVSSCGANSCEQPSPSNPKDRVDDTVYMLNEALSVLLRVLDHVRS